MTKEQFEDLKERLSNWRDERGLSVEDQQKNFKVNYTKELVEFFEAERDGNEYEMVDALCDMLVVAINAGVIKHTDTFKISNNFLSFGLEHSVNNIFCTFDLMGYDPYLCLLETIKELESRTGSWSEKEGKWIKDKGAYNTSELNKDLIKNICGEDNDYWYFTPKLGKELGIEIGKIKKWYKADYEKCKVVRW